MRNRRWSKSKAFTLIEILIVVVILGILAAIVVPQFTKASEDAQVGNVQTQLQTVRSQIELYRVKNNGAVPDFNGGLGGTWGDPAGATPLAQGLLGNDYMKAAPVNPRTNKSTIVAGASHTVGSINDGWVWDAATRTLYASYFDEVAASDGDPLTNAWTGP